MADRGWRVPASDEDLSQALEDVGRHLDSPAGEGLAAAVVANLRRGPARQAPPAGRPRRSRLRVAAAVGALALAGGAVLSPAIADWLGLSRVSVTRPERPVTAELGRPLLLGQRVTEAEAERALGQTVPRPAPRLAGQPAEVYVGGRPDDPIVALVYRARPGIPPAAATGAALLVTAVRGEVAAGLIEKQAAEGVDVEKVAVDGGPGLWFEGRPHGFLYRDRSGQIVPESVRLAGNVLLWERDGLLLRMEADISRDRALALARSFR